MNNKISIIIPIVDSKVLEYILLSLKNQTYLPYEIILIDNGNDKDIKKLSNKYKTKYYKGELNRSEARNKGCKIASGDILTFLDQDMIPNYTYLELVNQWFQGRRMKTVLEGTRQEIEFLSEEEYKLLKQDWNFTNYFKCKKLNNIEHLEQLLTYDCPSFNKYIKAKSWIFGANNISYKKDKFEKIEGFDENFDGYGEEDTELHWRMFNTGFRFYTSTRAKAYHVKHTISNHEEAAYKNAKYFCQKYNYNKELIKARKKTWANLYNFKV